MTTSGSQHPLAFFADILFAGLATVACIAVYLVAIAVIKAVLQWWRGGARRFERVQKLAALDNAMRTPVRREECRCEECDPHYLPCCTEPYPLADLTVRPQWERIAEQRARCRRCLTDDPLLPCSCDIGECWSVHCLAWAAPKGGRR